AFTGSDPQVQGPFNSVPASTMSAVYYAVRAIPDASIPNNGGCFRAVDAVLPEGTIVNPRPPAPVSCRTATIKRIADTILGALVAARPGKMPAASSGTLLVMAFGGHDLEGGAPGARAHAFIVRRDGTREDLPSKKMIVLHPGDQLWEYIAGGAGYGDPLDRDPAAVLADMLDGKIASPAEYGVVLTLDGAAVDEVKTKERREGLAGRRTGGGGG